MANFPHQMDANSMKINFDDFRYDHFVISEPKILTSKSRKLTTVLEFLLFTNDKENQQEVQKNVTSNFSHHKIFLTKLFVDRNRAAIVKQNN